MATGKSDDELIQLDNKMRIWTRSGKFRKMENPEFSMAWWQSTTRTPMTTSMIAWHCMTRTPMTTFMIAWHCTMRTPTTTSTDIHMSVSAHSLVCCTVSHHLHTHRGSRCLSLSPHPHGHLHVSVSPHLDSPFLFPALPHVPIFFLQFLKFVVNLHTPPNESLDSTDEFSLSTEDSKDMYRQSKTVDASCDCKTDLVQAPWRSADARKANHWAVAWQWRTRKPESQRKEEPAQMRVSVKKVMGSSTETEALRDGQWTCCAHWRHDVSHGQANRRGRSASQEMPWWSGQIILTSSRTASLWL